MTGAKQPYVESAGIIFHGTILVLFYL